MGASKKSQMKHLVPDWAEQMFLNASKISGGRGAAWILPLCAIAVTGARPAALEKGIQFSIEERGGIPHLVATIPGVKLKDNAGQDWYSIMWNFKDSRLRGRQELMALLVALHQTPGQMLTIQYDAEAISTRLRELSKSIWPRKKYHISAYSYREAFARAAKTAGVEKSELACAMGHLSERSQRQYDGARKKSRSGKQPKRPFTLAIAAQPVKKERPQMERFKVMTLRKRNAVAKFGAKSPL